MYSYGREETIDQERTSLAHCTPPISFAIELHFCLEVTVMKGVETQNEETLEDGVQKKMNNIAFYLKLKCMQEEFV